MASNVTVNGEPLEIYRDREVNAEIHEEREKATKVKLYRGIKTKSTRSNGTKIQARVVDVSLPQRYVLIKGEVFNREAKEPLGDSGLSILGAIEYNPVTDTMRCHEQGCGEWHNHLANHIRQHHLTSSDYKERHGLSRKCKLISPRLREKYAKLLPKNKPIADMGVKGRETIAAMRSQGWSNTRVHSVATWNIKDSCPDQILYKLKTLAKHLGRTPTWNDVFVSNGDHAKQLSLSAVKAYYGDFHGALKAAGLEPTSLKGRSRFTKIELAKMLRQWAVANLRIPTLKDTKLSALPSRRIFTTQFGTWSNALAFSGLIKSHESSLNA